MFDALVAGVLAGKRTALARAISIIENQRTGFEGVLGSLHARIEHVGEHAEETTGRNLFAELGEHTRAPGLDEPLAQPLVSPEDCNGLGDRLGLSWRHEQHLLTVAQDFGHRTDMRRYDRAAGGKRLERDAS